MQRVTSDLLQRVASATSNEQISQRVTSILQRVTSNGWKVTPPLDSRSNLSPSRECIIEAVEMYLTNNSSTLAAQSRIQTNETAIGAANSCSFNET